MNAIGANAASRPVRIAALQSRAERFMPLAVFIGAVLVFTLRRPQVLLDAEFRGEDGQIFYVGTWFFAPLEYLFEPHAYLYVGLRAIALVSRLAPVEYAPLVTNGLSIAVTAGVVAYIATRLDIERPIRVALAALVVVLPGVSETHGQLAWLGWYLAPFVLAVPFARRPDSQAGRWSEAAAVFVAGLSTPLIVVLAPLYLRSRDRALVAAAVVTAAAQLVTGLVVPRPFATGSAPEFVGLLLVRAIGEPFIGERIMAMGADAGRVAISAAVAGLMVLAMRRAPLRWVGLAGYVWVVTLGTVLLKSADPFAYYVDGITSNRYFLLPGMAVAGLAVAVAIRTRTAAALALCAVLAIGIAADFAIDPLPTYEWAARSDCIGGEAPCVVPVFPRDVFSIDWPGVSGTYRPIGARDWCC